jgi:hypothetical protein
MNEQPIIFIKTKRNTYIFNPKTTYYSYGAWRINKKLEVAACESCEINIHPVCVESVSSSQVVDYYVDKDNIILSADEYARKINLLEKDAIYDSDYLYNKRFPTLEQEFEYRLFRDKWKEIKKLVKTYSEIPFVVKNEVISEYPEIVPLAQYGENFTDTSCSLKFSPKSALNIAIEEINKDFPNMFVIHSEYGKPPEGWKYGISECSHSGIHYYKINGEYAFTDNKKYETQLTFNGSYEECVSERRKYIDGVKKILESFAFKKECKRLKEYERVEVLQSINDTIKLLDQVDPTKKTQDYFYKAKTKMRNLVEYINEKK